MSVQVENLEKNMAKLTITIPAESFDKAIQGAYNKQKSRISIPGFRKGKVPRAMIEKVYGPEVFYEDAANDVINREYPQAMDESELDIVSRPEIEIVQIGKGQEFIFEAKVAVKPEVTLGEYKGITVTEVDTKVTDGEIEAELENTRNMQARTVEVTDRPVQQGDIVVIDYQGFSDGVAFEGGKGENHSLEIGSHTFIDTFEDQLVGKNAGDHVEVNVTFPEEYHAAELAGKPALFKVKIHTIKTREIPDLDDEYASMVSEYETLDEYREDVKKKLEERKKEDAKHTQENEAVQKIVETSQMDIPEPMIEMQCENIIQEFANRISQQGLTMDQYFQFSGTNINRMKEQVHPEAIQRIQNSLVLEQIAKTENMEVSEEETEEELRKIAASYGMPVEKLKEFVSEDEKENMKNDLLIQKAVDYVMENSIMVAAAETEEAGSVVDAE